MPGHHRACRGGPRPVVSRTAHATEARVAEPLQERLRRALQHVTDPPVELRETHLSWVLLTPDRAVKLRKPVHHAFVDQSTPAQRRGLSEAEARINTALAPGLVLGVRAVVPMNTSFVLAPPDTPGAIDWVVEMRRFDEERTMAALLARDALAPEQVTTLATRLAAFHRGATPVHVTSPVARVHAMCHRNTEELLPLVDGVVPATEVLAAERFAAAFVVGHRDVLAARAAAGHVVDGHGDLRAEHVVFEDDGVLVVDRLEFDRDLRTVDAADDLAFLVMDLLSLGGVDAAERLVSAYREAGGDPGDDALIAFFGVYRALVRAKVALLRVRELDGDANAAVLERARSLLALASRLTWRGRGPMLLLVTGPPASGKSTLARALAAASGLPVLSSDRERKRALGIAEAQQAPGAAYTDAQRADVYRHLADGADALLAGGGGIIDATFASPAVQRAFLDGLSEQARDAVRVVRCSVDPEVAARRAAERPSEDAAGSDAGPEVAAKLAAEMTAFPVASARRLVIETDADEAELVERVAAWLDGQLARG